MHRPALRHTFIVPPPVDLLRIHLPAAGHLRNTRPRHQRLPDDRRLLRRRPAATTDRSARNRNTPIVTLRIIITVKHDNRPKLPSASGKTNISIAAVKEGRQPTAYEHQALWQRILLGLRPPVIRNLVKHLQQ